MDAEPTQLHVAGLFAGIGGLELGFEKAGHVTELLCEIDPAARQVLTSRFSRPLESIEEDVRRIDGLPASVDVVTAGFPCQDLSSTGEKNGIKGSRSSLVGEVFRLLADRPVEWVVIENVPFMLHLGRGSAMRFITEELERLGYRWAYRVVDTQAFGLPQRRRRVFFVASQSNDPRNVVLADESGPEWNPGDVDTWTLDAPIGFYWTEGTYSTGLAYDSVPPIKGGSTIGIPSPPAILFPDGLVGKPDLRDAERLQGFPADWTAPAAEVARPSFRWRLVGNAVTVDVAEWVGARLASPGAYDPSEDLPLAEGARWPNAAWSMGRGSFAASGASQHPCRIPRRGLSTFMEHGPVPLSEKATRGFLKRAAKGKLRFPKGFLGALQSHLERVEVT